MDLTFHPGFSTPTRLHYAAAMQEGTIVAFRLFRLHFAAFSALIIRNDSILGDFPPLNLIVACAPASSRGPVIMIVSGFADLGSPWSMASSSTKPPSSLLEARVFADHWRFTESLSGPRELLEGGVQCRTRG